MGKDQVVALFVLALSLGACGSNGCLEVIGERAEVVRQPYPLNYPSTDPRPNEVLRTIAPGTRILWDKVEYGKDYRVFRVEGEDGWVVDGDNLQRCPGED